MIKTFLAGLPGPALARLVWALTALVMLSLSTACNREGSVEADSVKLDAGVINVEGDPWSGYAPFRDRDFVTDSRYKYSYKDELAQKLRADNLTAGRTDFLVTTMDRFLKNKPAGQIVAVIDQSLGADAFVLNTRKHAYLRSIDQLPRLVAEARKQGSKPVIAFTGDSPSEWLLIKLANTRSDELKLSDYELVPVDVSTTALNMMQEGKADVAVLWEPDVATARKAGFTVALSSKDVPGAVVDVLVASNRIIKNAPETVQHIVNSFYHRYGDRAARDRSWFVKFIAEDGKASGLDEAGAELVVQGVRYYDARSADEFMNKKVYPLDETGAFEALQTIGGIVSLSDTSVVPLPEMINGQFAARAAAESKK